MSRDPSTAPATEAPRFPIVAAGGGAGALEAFAEILRRLPPDTGMAYVFAPHPAADPQGRMAETLAGATAMAVTEVRDEPRLAPDHVYLVPPGQTMRIAGGQLRTAARPAFPGPARTVDTILRSLAENQPHDTIGVILSGAGSDGTAGLAAVRAGGGLTLAQDATAAEPGMPQSAVAAGCIDLVLPPAAIAGELLRIARHAQAGAAAAPAATILDLLHAATGVDFSQYKPTTLSRRIGRRVLLLRLSGLDEYVRVLQDQPAELQRLYTDLLVNVTAFFRDPAGFEALARTVLPQLMADRSARNPLRLWVPACSTGEEAYSLAITIAEIADERGLPMAAQVFATDLNERSVETARAGRFPRAIAHDVSPERLRRFFVERDGDYQVVQPLRELCVFARHNLLEDPPFSRLDLLSCRNLLIYLEPALQRRLIPVFHYALRPGGVLWLGSSENAGGAGDLFEAIDARQKLFVRRPGPPAAAVGRAAPAWEPRNRPRAPQRPADAAPPDLQREADRAAAAAYAPPGVLVTADFDVQQFRGDTGHYLVQPEGRPTTNLLKMARDGLLVPLRAALQRARTDGAGVRTADVRITSTTGVRSITLHVLPVGESGPPGGFLVLFEEPGQPERPPQPLPRATVAAEVSGEAAASEIARLTQELTATREYMQALVEQQEATNEELQSANEEIQSANEELQSVNEELQTSKEEIQSSNEELTTVNEELCHRNEQLARTQNDLNNFIASSQLPMVMVDTDLRIRRFSPAAEHLWRLIAADLGRPIASLTLPIDCPDLEERLGRVINAASTEESEVRDRNGAWYSLRLRPYRTAEGAVDGAILLLIDIAAQKRAQEEMRAAEASVRESEARYRHLVESLPAAVFTCDPAGRVTLHNRAAAALWGREPEPGDGQWSGAWRTWRPDGTLLARDALPMAQAMRTGRPVEGEELVIERPDGSRTHVLPYPVPMLDAGTRVTGGVNMLVDLTELDRVHHALRESQTQLHAALSAARTGTWHWEPATDQWRMDASLGSLLGAAPGADMCCFADFLDTLHPEDRERVRATFERAARGENDLDVDFRTGRGNGAARWLKARGDTVVQPSGAPCLTGACVDISDRVAAAERLQAADRRKNEFLATLAHELRNPLAPLVNALEILRRSGAEPATVAHGRELIERQVQKLTRLVDDLLDVARISRGRIELRREAVDLRAVIERALESTQHHFAAAGHDLSLRLPPEPIVVDGDATRLEQVVTNLLHNAATYTDPGGRIAIALEVADRPGDGDGRDAVVRVQDTGAGLSPELRERIFDLFARGDTSYARHTGGLGIGLSLAKTLLELHGGRIEASSDGPGRGSEFACRLPLTPAAVDPSAGAAPPAGAGAAARRILVVDDNVDAAETTALLLRVSGHEVAVAHGGPAALEAAAAFRPDIILLDLGMPGMDGFEVARELRRQAGFEKTRLVALSGYGTEDDRRRAREAGFDAHLVKPADLAALTRVLTASP